MGKAGQILPEGHVLYHKKESLALIESWGLSHGTHGTGHGSEVTRCCSLCRLKAPKEAFQVHTLQDKNDAFSISDPQFPTSRPCTNKKEEVQRACEYIIMRKKRKYF